MVYELAVLKVGEPDQYWEYEDELDGGLVRVIFIDSNKRPQFR